MKRAVGLLLGTLFAMCMGSACDEVVDASEDLCGPCGSVQGGDAFISGDARIDGVFRAVGTVGTATAQIEMELEEQLLNLASAFDVDGAADMSIEELASAVRAAVDTEVNANVHGSLEVDFVPPRCSAAVDVAVEAQAHCEAQAGCEMSAECESGDVAVACSGTCSGVCSGTCQGGCVVESSGICSGICTGACQMEEMGGTCEGICRGECAGHCSLIQNDGSCEGTCEGECSGSCELKAGGECSGECHGTCEVNVDTECEGECHGACDAGCSGGCEGEVTPPSCSTEGSCEATADCQAAAKAQGSASLDCTPPSLTFRYDFKAALEEEDRARFVAKMAALKVSMMGIVQGMFKMRALFDPEYAADLGVDPPLVMIGDQMKILFEADLDSFDIPPGRYACLVPAIEEAIGIMTKTAGGLAGTFQAQITIVGVLDVL